MVLGEATVAILSDQLSVAAELLRSGQLLVMHWHSNHRVFVITQWFQCLM